MLHSSTLSGTTVRGETPTEAYQVPLQVGPAAIGEVY